MKEIIKHYPNHFNSFFIHYNKQEKKSIILLFVLILANSHFISWELPQSLPDYLWGFVILTNIAVLGKLTINNANQFNIRIYHDQYRIIVDKDSKALKQKLYKTIFIKKLVTQYPKFEDLKADWDEEYKPSKPNINKLFRRFLFLMATVFFSVGTFLLDGKNIHYKITYLAFTTALLLASVIVYFQFSPPVKDIFENRYKRNRQILDIVNEIMFAIKQLPSAYIVGNDLKTLVLSTGLIDPLFEDYFKKQIKKEVLV